MLLLLRPICAANIADIRAMPPEEAALAKPVTVRGVVTYYDGRDYNGLFLQDESASIYVELPPGVSSRPGESVELAALTGPGHFAPNLRCESLRVVDQRGLPSAREVSFQQLHSGSLDCQFVQVKGVVRSVAPATHRRIYLDVMLGNDRLRTLVSDAAVEDAANLVASTVEVEGVCFARFNKKRQLLACWLGVNSLSAVKVLDRAEPVTAEIPISGLMQFSSTERPLGRVRVRGAVTHQEPGKWIFIRDESQGLLVKTQQNDPLAPGDLVEVLGFAALGQYEPFLEDGLFKKVADGPPPAPARVRPEDLLSGECDADLVSFEARVVDRMRRGNEETLVLSAGELLFNAQLENASEALSRRAPNGGKVLVTGICLVQPLEHWRPRQNARAESFRIALRSPADVALIEAPPWLTLARALCTLAAVTALALLAALWAVVLRRRVREQTRIIGEKLKQEAILEERSRLARELHDTVEQELVGITMQLDAAAARFKEEPPVARQFLDLARTMSRRSFSEVRRSVWDLRSHFLESGDLGSALREIVKPIKNGSSVELNVRVIGEPRRRSALIENNFLRIGQEAVSNAVKHAGAARIELELRHGSDDLRLTIRDDGAGFRPSPETSPGHFGLLDMRERAEKMGGQFAIKSVEGQGTCITVVVQNLHEAQA